MKRQYMVTFELPDPMPMEFIRLIPEQRNMINYLLAEGIVKSYALSADRSTLWMIILEDSEFDVLDRVTQMPLSDYLIPEVSELAFVDSQERVLEFSLN